MIIAILEFLVTFDVTDVQMRVVVKPFYFASLVLYLSNQSKHILRSLEDSTSSFKQVMITPFVSRFSSRGYISRLICKVSSLIARFHCRL